MFNRLTSTNNSNPNIKPPSAFFSNKINRISVLQCQSFYTTFWRFFFFSFLRPSKIGKINGNGSSVNYITVNGHVKIFSVLERKPADVHVPRRWNEVTRKCNEIPGNPPFRHVSIVHFTCRFALSVRRKRTMPGE